MNKADRKVVSDAVSKLEALKEQIENIGTDIRALADAEQEKFDNMSDGLQQGEQGQAIETAAQTLDTAAQALEDGNAVEALEALGEIEL